MPIVAVGYPNSRCGLQAWRDIEVVPDPRGKPLVVLHNRARARATELGLTAFEISLSHSRDMAIAMVVAQGADRAES